MISRKYLTIAIALAAGLVLAGCQGQTDIDTTATVATVNGHAIHQDTLDVLLGDAANNKNPEALARQKHQLLDRLVTLKALAEKARAEGLAKTSKIQVRMEIQRESLLAHALVKKHLKEHPVTDQDIQAAYQKHVAGMGKHQYKARHILVKDKKTAETVIDKLNNGADFASLAKKYSIDPGSKNKGGELGWFSPSNMVQPFTAAVEKLKKGEYTKKPVHTRFGWHVILLQDIRKQPQPKLSDLKTRLQRSLQQENVQSYIKAIRDQAKVDIRKPKQKSTATEPQKQESSATQNAKAPVPAAKPQQPEASNAK